MNLDNCGERVTGKLDHIQDSKGERRVCLKVSPQISLDQPQQELSFLFQVTPGV